MNRNEEEQTEVKAAIFATIDFHAELFGSEEWFSQGVKKELVRSLLNGFSHWSLEDIILFFHQAVRGQLSKCYGKITFVQVMEWAKEYDEEWHNNNRRRHEQRTQEENTPIDKEVARKSVGQILNNLGYKEFDHEGYRKFKAEYFKKSQNENDDKQGS